MRVVVTGGSGYIGLRVAEELAKRDDVDEIVDVDVRPPLRAVAKLRWENRSVTGDLRDVFAGAGARVDLALHLAWTVDPLRDADLQRAICIGGTGRFLDACVEGDVRHVVFVSSASAYGANPAHATPVGESEPLKDRFHFQYSAEKREAEGLLRRFEADRPGTLVQIVRPCIVAGPNVSNFIFRSVERRVLLRAIGHDPPLQLVHEDDCARAIAAIAASRLAGAFNVAADGMLRASEIARRAGVLLVPVPVAALRGVASLAWRRGWTGLFEAPPEFVWFLVHPWVVSNERLKTEVGYRFAHTTEETFEVMLRTIAERRAKATAR